LSITDQRLIWFLPSVEYVDINPNAKHTLLFLHGWPSLWASWKYQIQEFRVSGALLFNDSEFFS
jgi:soluble epoxide hydrolase/lipid-phosphate phosphatase